MPVRRRELLLGLGGGVVATAGCIGADDDPSVDSGERPEYADTEPNESNRNSDEQVVPNTELYDFPPPDEPAVAPDDMLCGVCNHTPADWPGANGQVVHDDEHRQFLCSPGCLVSYTVAPAQFVATAAPIARSWGRAVPSGSIHPIDDFYWVIDTSRDADRGIDPMHNPLPYTSWDDAVEFVDGWQDLTVDDIVETAELDRELASNYRGVDP